MVTEVDAQHLGTNAQSARAERWIRSQPMTRPNRYGSRVLGGGYVDAAVATRALLALLGLRQQVRQV